MPSKKVSMRASMANQISHFGIMGGLYNRKISGRSSLNRVTSRLEIPAGAEAGLRYMKLHNLLSRNPLGSGGVGRMFTIRPRGSGLGSHLGSSSKNNLGDSLGSDDKLCCCYAGASMTNYGTSCDATSKKCLSDCGCSWTTTDQYCPQKACCDQDSPYYTVLFCQQYQGEYPDQCGSVYNLKVMKKAQQSRNASMSAHSSPPEII